MHHYGAGTNVGNVRDNNEDSYVCDAEKELWIVADGMGGLGFGEVASAITTYTVATLVREGHGVNQAIEVAHKNIKAYADSDGLGTNMGTTIVLLLSHGSLYNIFWVGDSRAYLFDNGAMKQITVDHSLVQSLIDQGEITREEASTDPRKNAVTRALGVKEIETVRADSVSERWQPNQKILLCSDGLTDCVRDDVIEDIMRNGESDQAIVDELIEAALEGGGNDNITVIVVSAPTAAKSGDSDTHVPDGEDGTNGNDDTYIPNLDDDTQSRYHDTRSNADNTLQAAFQQVQLSLPLESAPRDMTIGEHSPMMKEDADRAAGVIPLTLKVRDSSPAPIERRGFWQRIGTMAVAVACLVVLFTIQFDDTDAAPLSEHFTATDIPSSEPIQRNLPTRHFERSGPILQVGLFTQLGGAEARQRELTKIGLLPHIEKRSADNGSSIEYAVMLGPLGEAAHQKALTELEAFGISYFHRTGAG